jgi:hypothetical protein
MLSVIMLSAIMLTIVMLSVIMLSVVMLSVVMLSVIMECHYAECHGTFLSMNPPYIFGVINATVSIMTFSIMAEYCVLLC